MHAMSRLLITVTTLIALLLSTRTALAAEVAVTWDFTVSPTSVSINVGDSVRWNGSLANHPLAESNASFSTATPVIANTGTTFLKTFTSPGTYYFICDFHRSMRLTVNVAGPVCNPPANPVRLDVDGDGTVNAATDGVLVVRYLLGLRGTSLTNGAVAACRGRDDAAVETYLQSMVTQ